MAGETQFRKVFALDIQANGFADIERHCKTQSFAGFEFTVEMWLEHFKKQVLETYQHCKEIDSAPAERK